MVAPIGRYCVAVVEVPGVVIAVVDVVVLLVVTVAVVDVCC